MIFHNYAPDSFYDWNYKELSFTRFSKKIRFNSFIHTETGFTELVSVQIRRSTRCCPTKETQTEWSQGISFFMQTGQGSLGKIRIIRTLLWSKGWWGKKQPRVLHLSGPSESRENVWDVYVKEMTYMSTISRPTRERNGWVERNRKKKKSLWKMKCDSQSLRIENLDHEFPRRWETFSRFTPPLQSTTSALITQPESNLVSLVFAEA